MRDCKRNQTTIYYALRNVAIEEDEWGNTNDVTTYGDPVQLEINVSANKGEASAQAFGTDLKYDREMLTHDMSCPIDEYTHLWLDEISLADKTVKTARSDGDTISVTGTKAHNYEVAAVSKSLNCIRYAIRRVNVKKCKK